MYSLTITKPEHSVYLRSLHPDDAHVSFQWRNDPRIWKFTGSKPNKYITYEIESEWLEAVLKRKNEKRFAICMSGTDKYIGNIFFTDMTSEEAYIHIFIGDMEFWGKGRAFEAANQICEYGFEELRLKAIYAEINQKNRASLELGKASGFEKVDEYYDDNRKMTLVKLMITEPMFQHFDQQLSNAS